MLQTFSQFLEILKNGIFKCCSSWTFQFFPFIFCQIVRIVQAWYVCRREGPMIKFPVLKEKFFIFRLQFSVNLSRVNK